MINELLQLEREWKRQKDIQDNASRARVKVEEEILALGGKPELIKIQHRKNEKWDSAKLEELKANWGNTVFPFRVKYEKDASLMKALELQDPEKARLLEYEALTITDAKPTFTWRQK